MQRAFRAIADLAPDPMLLASREGRILATNRAFDDLAGADLSGRSLDEVCPSTRSGVSDLLRACRRSTGRVPGRVALRTARGEVSMRCVGQIAEAGGDGLVVRFVTPGERDAFAVLNERLRGLEDEMRRRMENDARIGWAESGLPGDVRTVFDVMPQLGWVARADGWIHYFNRSWCEYVGRSMKELEGWGWQVAHDPEVLPHVLERWRASLETGSPFEMLFPIRRHDGVFRWFMTRATPIRDARGDVVRWIGINTDVDDRKRAEDALEIANRAKDEFLATISHELRTPLHAIHGWTSMLRRGSPPREIDRGLEVIERNAKAQARLIDDVLDLSRIISGKLRLELSRVNVAEIVLAAVDTVRAAADAKEIHLQAAVEPLLPLDADPDRLQQVVWNLATNAVKFTPKGGSVIVVARHEGPHVVIEVRDDGEGKRPELLGAIFEPFRQADASTSRKHGGLGLGLALVHRLAQAHGGTVSVSSEGPGKGSTFTVRLPTASKRAVSSPAEPDQRPAPRLDDRKILVVDDEADARELVCAILERSGAECRTAESAAAALETFRRFRPDVLLSDIAMPNADGYELVRRIRSLSPGEGGATPAIALTAYARPEDGDRARVEGFDEHLSKPVDPRRLVDLLASVCADQPTRRA